MAGPTPRSKATTFTIHNPKVNQASVGDSMQRVFVRVENLDPDNVAFTATIFNLGSTASVGSGNLIQEGTSSFFSGWIPAGILAATATGNHNKTVTVQAFKAGSVAAEPETLDFEAVLAGSGSFLAGASQVAGATLAAGFLRAGPPLPVALLLRLATPPVPRAQAPWALLNQPASLLYADTPDLVGCWLSDPIDFCPGSPDPGFWMLQGSEPGTWTLLLQHGKTAIITYRLATSTRNALSFPLILQREENGAPGSKDWPATVTLSPAP